MSDDLNVDDLVLFKTKGDSMKELNRYARFAIYASTLLLGLTGAGLLQAHDLQICKQSDPIGPVTGTFSFKVTGQQGMVGVAVGSCTLMSNIGAGTFTVAEQPGAGIIVTEILVSPISDKVSTDLAAGTAVVTVAEGATTTVTFTNAHAITTGRFTGGGSIFTDTGVRVTHGFELHCSTAAQPNSLEVNWAGNMFHLESLTSVACFVNPTTGVATITGTGTGEFDGVPNATISFTFTDAGEPGRLTDFASIVVKDSGGTTVLSASGLLDSGNQQFHAQP